MPDGNLNPDPWLPNPAPPLWPAVLVQVYRIKPTSTPESGPPSVELSLLPNVEVVAVQKQEGPDPGSCVLRYRFDGQDDHGPQSLEQALSTAYTTFMLPHLVDVGDWLGVFVLDQVDGEGEWIFSGFPLEWEGHLSGNTEAVTMNCTGVAKRLWDTPFAGAITRNSDAIETGGNDVPTDVVPQFNPLGRANASPSTGDSGSSPYTYPVFADPDITGTDAMSNPYPQTWDVEGAVAHLLFTGNKSQYWVSNPTRTQLQDLLISREPIEGTPFDPTDSSTYTAKPIAAPDDPLSGKALPILVHDMVKDSGFGMEFYCGTGEQGPICSLNLFLKQAGPVKSIYLASRLSPLDAGANNVASCHLARDLSGVINQWTVDGGLDHWEASYILFNAFPSTSGDSAVGNLPNYKSSSAGFATSAYHDAYRTYILDETGEGHYVNGSSTKVTTATSLDDLFEAPAGDPPVPTYVRKRRAPIGDLLTLDKMGNKLKFQVHVSKIYSGSDGLWDGTASDWQPFKCGISLLKDRIGFRITEPDPNHIDIGVSSISGAPFPDGKVNLVELIASGASLTFRLTCVVAADQGLTYTAAPIGTSPVTQTIERRIDARDRYQVAKIYAPSAFLAGSTPFVTRDDTDYAAAEAIAMRTATDSGVFAAEVEIPYFTTYYQIGDKIDQIMGRDLGLRTDTGGPGYLPVLPIVTGVRWELEGGQKTILTLGDSGLDRRRYRNRRSAAISRATRPTSTVRPRGILSTSEHPASARDGTGAI